MQPAVTRRPPGARQGCEAAGVSGRSSSTLRPNGANGMCKLPCGSRRCIGAYGRPAGDAVML
eukprot:scaffold76765_cov48-Prasinocladus_malaysianus.AAC.1